MVLRKVESCCDLTTWLLRAFVGVQKTVEVYGVLDWECRTQDSIALWGHGMVMVPAT